MNMNKKQEHIITILPGNKKISIADNSILSEALEDLNIFLDMPCGGKGICGKCKILVDNEVKLACKTRINKNITIDISKNLEKKKSLNQVLSIPCSDYGAAVDIGTTTINITLVDMVSSKKWELSSLLNPQKRFGQDVISRISLSSEDKLIKMRDLLLNEIFEVLVTIFKENNLDQNRLKQIVFSGNTVMAYILNRIDLSPIQKHPYSINTFDFPETDGNRANFPYFKNTKTVTLPCFSAFLGGDFASGLVITIEKYKDKIFFIDIGTNGEIYLKYNNKIYATSCPMGPALEGMNITHGMVASPGAIIKAGFENNKITLKTLGDTDPTGIAGSGLIDLVSIFIQENWISPEGNIINNFETIDNQKIIWVTKNIYISQKDIRQVQLAKGASLSAAQTLIKISNIKKENINHCLIAGTFGKKININNFKILKFLPEFTNAEYIPVGNTSLEGAVKSIENSSFISKCKSYHEKIEIVDLTSYQDFNEIYMNSLNF